MGGQLPIIKGRRLPAKSARGEFADWPHRTQMRRANACRCLPRARDQTGAGVAAGLGMPRQDPRRRNSKLRIAVSSVVTIQKRQAVKAPVWSIPTGTIPDYSRAICCEAVSAFVGGVGLHESSSPDFNTSAGDSFVRLATQLRRKRHLRPLATIFMNNPGYSPRNAATSGALRVARTAMRPVSSPTPRTTPSIQARSDQGGVAPPTR